MKKVIFSILILGSVFMLFGCGAKTDPIETALKENTWKCVNNGGKTTFVFMEEGKGKVTTDPYGSNTFSWTVNEDKVDYTTDQTMFSAPIDHSFNIKEKDEGFWLSEDGNEYVPEKDFSKAFDEYKKNAQANATELIVKDLNDIERVNVVTARSTMEGKSYIYTGKVNDIYSDYVLCTDLDGYNPLCVDLAENELATVFPGDVITVVGFLQVCDSPNIDHLNTAFLVK